MNLPQQHPTRSQPAPILSTGSIALSLFVSILSTFSGCGWEHTPVPAPRVNPLLPTLVIVATGDTGGRLTATNCGVARSGGVDRRAALLESLPPGSNPIVLEAGGAASGDLPADRVTWEYLLRAEQALGTAAHNLGREELALAPELLAKLAKETQIPWVSSNTKTAAQNKSKTNKPGENLATERYLSEPLRVVERGPATVVILGVVSPRAATTEVLIEEPAKAVRTVLADYGWQQKRPAALVVLADLDADEIGPLTNSLPPQTLLINRGTIMTTGNETTHRVAIAQVPAAGEGAVVAEFDLNAVASNDEPDQWTITTPLLNGKQNPEFTPLLAAYQRELAKGEFTAHDSTWATRRGQMIAPLKETLTARIGALAFAGSQHCRACHTTTSLHFDTTPHAAAWQALVDRGQQHEARCQRCHTTGFNSGDQPGLAQGFVSARQTPQFTAVSCEACHGPSAAHTLEPTTPTPWVAKQSCAQCHDAEHSPGFEVDAAWLRIHHPPQPAADATDLGFGGPRF